LPTPLTLPSSILFPYTTLFRSHDYSPNDYSIETTFSFSQLSSFRKILDFKDRTVDAGLYNSNGALDFFPLPAGPPGAFQPNVFRSEEHTSELQSRSDLVCRLLL